MASSFSVSGLIRLAQRQPATWLGRRRALLLRRLALALHSGPIDAEVEGIRFRFRPHDNVGERKFLFMPRFFDPEERALLRAALPPDGVFVDIGANVGIYALTAACAPGFAGRVLAFEPNPVALARLRGNIALNDADDRIEVLPFALADAEGEVTLHLDPANLGGGSIERAGAGGGGVTVAARPLAAVLAERGVARIDVLKIDVEGAEHRVLLPFFAQAPAALYPRHLIVERSEWPADLLGVLAAQGYAETGTSKMNHIFTRTAPAVQKGEERWTVTTS